MSEKKEDSQKKQIPQTPQTPPIPQRIRHLYAHTSLWILFAAANVHEHDIFMTLLLIGTFVASVSHWTWYEHNSFRHYADRLCASVVILYCLWGQPITSQTTLFSALAVASFVAAYFIILAESTKMAWHLLFRFWAFSACMSRNAPYPLTTHLLHSTAYIIHVAFLWCQ